MASARLTWGLQHVEWSAEFALQPGRFGLAASCAQCVDRGLGDLTDPADLLAEFGEFVEAVGGLGAAPGAQEFPAGTEVLVIGLSAALRFDVPVIVTPAARVPAAMDGLMLRLTLFQRHMFQDRPRVTAGGRGHDEFGHFPRSDQHLVLRVLRECERVAGQLIRIQTQLGGDGGGITQTDGTGLAVAHLDAIVAEQQLDDGLGSVFAGVIQWQARRIDPVPARLPRLELINVFPPGFQPGGRYPLLPALERLIGELDQHPRGPLRAQPDDCH